MRACTEDESDLGGVSGKEVRRDTEEVSQQ